MKRSTRASFQLSLFNEETVSVQFVAELLGRSESSIKRLLDEGRLRSYQHCKNGEHFILKSSLDEYEKALRIEFGLGNPPHINGGNGSK